MLDSFICVLKKALPVFWLVLVPLSSFQLIRDGVRHDELY